MSTSSINTSTHLPAQTGTILDHIIRSITTFGHDRIKRLVQMYTVYTERREMRNLSDEMLNDMGITRVQLNKECQRGFSDLPDNRK